MHYVYIGSTAEPTLARRLAKHRTDYKYYLSGKGSYVITSYDILENENYCIILIENCSCDSKDQLKARERFHIENNECVNKNIPGRTTKEYHMDNKDRKKKHDKEYYANNKERISEAKKEYYTNNKERISEAKKKYYVNNKERINNPEKHTCNVCGSVYKMYSSSRSRHEKSIKYQNALNLQDQSTEG